MSNSTYKNRYQTFGSSRYPVAKSSTLWRYLQFEKFVSLLETKCLYHARLDCLGDPFEGSVTAPYASQRDSGESPNYMPIPELEPANNKRRTLVQYATCWHRSEDESPAMWKLYSQEDKGVAVVTTFQRLAESVDTSSVRHAILGPVEYFDYSTDDMSYSLGLTGRPGFSKQHVFEHEKEVRGMVDFTENYPEELSKMPTDEHIEELRPTQPRNGPLNRRLQVHGHPARLLVFQRRWRGINPRNLLPLFKHLEDSRFEFARHFAQHIPLGIAAGFDPRQIRHSSGHRSIVVLVNANKASKHRNVGLGVASDPKRLLIIRIRLHTHLRCKVSRCIPGFSLIRECRRPPQRLRRRE